MPAYCQLIDKLCKPDGNSKAMVLDAAKPYLVAALYYRLKRPVLAVTAQPEDSKKLYEQLSTWCNSTQLRLFPEPDALPYQRTISDTTTELERLQVLSALANTDRGQNAPLVITSVPALMQKIVSHRDFTSTCHTIKIGQEFEPLNLLRRWVAMGYRVENIVEVPGTVSH